MIPLDSYQSSQGTPIANNLPFTFFYLHPFADYPLKIDALLQKEETLIN